VSETSSVFFADGVPRKIDFSIDLVRVDEDNFQAFRDQAGTSRDAGIGLGLYTPRRSGGGMIA
jgi:phage protein U